MSGESDARTLGGGTARTLKDLDDGHVTIDLEHLSAAFRAVGQCNVDDLRITDALDAVNDNDRT
jgi:hypothetical protein